MQTISLGKSPLKSSRLAYGLWRIAGTKGAAGVTPEIRTAGQNAILAAYEAGYTLFDNADIYCDGEAERFLGSAFKEISGLRERVLVATKCGVRRSGEPRPDSPARYDFSKEHILKSCEESLRRLDVQVIDLYMLHRPDFLANPEEIASAFSQLKHSGKVRFFGVSNFRPTLLTTLQKACPMPLLVNQVEISLAMLEPFTDGILDQCLSEKITPMAWSPLAAGLIGDGAAKLLPAQQGYRPEKFLPVLDEIARTRGVSRGVVALAWLLKHPSNIIPLVGSTRPERIRDAAKATELELSRDEWYRLLIAARGEPLP
ncbi:MAG TPA: aldo/keto reductase [Verrucomicrobiae bacterium]|nr:aldo/keto reductase [Verrucomicrobiae bacterium]